MGKLRGNTAAKLALIRVHSGDSFVFDDKRDFHFLTLLSEEIQDDQVNVITEGLQLQKALASSMMVYNSDEGGEEENSDGKLSPESALLVDASAVREEICSFTDSDDMEEEMNSAGKSAPATALLFDDSAVKEENRSFLEKSQLTSMKITDSGDTAEGKNSAGKSSPGTALIPDHSAAEDENWSFVEKSLFASSKITDSKNSAASDSKNSAASDSKNSAAYDSKNSAAKSSPEIALIHDESAAEDENWSFFEKSRLKSMKITDSAETGKVKNTASTSWPKSATLHDDFAPKDQNWAFLNEFCELCTTEDSERRLIRVSGCGHYFCNYCFEWYTSGELGSGNCSIKCPAETCYNLIEYDHCVALKLQNSLDTKDESMSDWEFLDSPSLP